MVRTEPTVCPLCGKEYRKIDTHVLLKAKVDKAHARLYDQAVKRLVNSGGNEVGKKRQSKMMMQSVIYVCVEEAA